MKTIIENSRCIDVKVFKAVLDVDSDVEFYGCDIYSSKLTEFIPLLDSQKLRYCKLTNVRVSITGNVDNMESCIFWESPDND